MIDCDELMERRVLRKVVYWKKGVKREKDRKERKERKTDVGKLFVS